MNIEIAAVVFGGLILSVGVLGGGFEVKELEVPKVGIGVRVVSVVVGVLFICLGFGGAMQGSPATRINDNNSEVYNQRRFRNQKETPDEGVRCAGSKA